MQMQHTQTQMSKELFIEEMGTLFELFSFPRMAGKILGWLLICVPPYQTANELIAAVGSSKGSISSMTRLLMHVGLVERIGRPGMRGSYFQIKKDSWIDLLKNRFSFIRAMRELADKGLTLMNDKETKYRQRLQEIRDLHAFLEGEVPVLFERWERKA